MKRPFLENLKNEGAPLSKEVIDIIMAENGRDIEAAKKPFEDYEIIKGQLEEAQTALADIKKNGATIEDAQRAAADWEQKYNEAIAAHTKAMADRDFSDSLSAAINGAKGKNAKAIMALLDTEALKGSKNQADDIKTAIETCQKENPYLFDDGGTPPPYAGGTGSQGMGGAEPTNLHDAIGAALFGSK